LLEFGVIFSACQERDFHHIYSKVYHYYYSTLQKVMKYGDVEGLLGSTQCSLDGLHSGTNVAQEAKKKQE
jgi:hypothetical protein